MGRLTIPESFREGVISLASLDENTVDNLVAALKEASESLSPEALASSLSKAPDLPNRGDWPQMLKALKALYGVRSESGRTIETFLDDLALSLREIGPRKFPKSKASEVRSRLQKLLSIKRIVISSNLRNQKTNYEKVSCKAQILTDLHPIFGDDPTEGPDGFVVSHKLKIGFHDNGGKHQDFFVSISMDDLMELRRQIKIAEEKAVSLNNLFGHSEGKEIR